MMAPSNAGTKHLERLFDPCVAKTLGLRFGKRRLRLGIARERPHAHAPQPARRADGSAERLGGRLRSEEHTSELQSLMRISYAVFCLKKKKYKHICTEIKPQPHINRS